MNDFETVREPHDIRCGDWARCRHTQALDRIEAEVERLRALYSIGTFLASDDDNEESLLRKALAEVERLRDGPMARVNAELRAEVERLRGDAEAQIQIQTEATVRAAAEVERWQARYDEWQKEMLDAANEVEHLRAALTNIERVAVNAHDDTFAGLARAALAKEEA